jgi:hypothetical protein
VEEIHLEDQSILSSFEEIKVTTSTHFAYLYTKKGSVDMNLKDQALSHIPQLVIERENEI